MAWRNLLLQKKRGGRSTGMRNLAHWSELLLSVSLVVVGGVTLALHIFQVLLPDWRESRAPQGFESGTCSVTRLDLHERAHPLSVGEYGIEIQASRVTDEGLLPPVWIERELGNFSPTRGDALQMAEAYEPGTTHRCWYDPDDPSRLILRRSMRWWVWPVALIPASLFGLGVFGIVASLMQVATSAERRSLVAVKAARLDPSRESPVESGVLPKNNQEELGPGARYPHRLRAVGTAGWRMAGLMFVSAIWNVLLSYFVYVASLQYLRGDPPWLALGLVVLLGMVGIWLAFNLIREFWRRRGIGQTQLEISEHPLALGSEYQAYLLQTGRMQLAVLSVELVCEEAASYRQGTDSRTSTEVVYRKELRKWRGLRVEPSQPFEVDFSFTIPRTAMHSFHSPHNQIRWMLLVQGETSRNQQVFRQFALKVRPPQQRVDPASLVIAESEMPETTV